MSRRGPFMSYFCDLCFIFIFVFIMINRVILWINTSLFFLLAFFGYVVLFLGDAVDEEFEGLNPISLSNNKNCK